MPTLAQSPRKQITLHRGSGRKAPRLAAILNGTASHGTLITEPGASTAPQTVRVLASAVKPHNDPSLTEEYDFDLCLIPNGSITRKVNQLLSRHVPRDFEIRWWLPEADEF